MGKADPAGPVIRSDFSLTHYNTLGLAATARYGATVTAAGDIAELSRFAARTGLPFHIMGGGSNLVLRERIEALVAVMATRGRAISGETDDAILVTAEAGEDWSAFVAWTVAQGLGGLENLAGIPGTVGAAPVQNIGAYGLELADRLHALTAYDTKADRRRVFAPDDCAFRYRHSLFKATPGRYVIIDVTFALPKIWQPRLNYAGLDALPASADAHAVMTRVLALRSAKLPDWRLLGNAGSFFQNPVVAADKAAEIPGAPHYPQADGSIKLSAAWLIEACGLKGAREGGAGLYEKHALIVVNNGGATFDDIARLSARIKRTVRDRFGVELVQEPVEF